MTEVDKKPNGNGNVNGNEAKVYSLIATTRAKYFGVVETSDKGIVIESAYEVKPNSTSQQIAKEFIKGELMCENRRIELSDNLIESVTDAPDETRLMNTYRLLIPDAEKRAVGAMTYKALEELMNPENPQTSTVNRR